MKKEILNNGMIRRAAVMLAVMLLTATTAWAQGVDYIDANGVMKNTATDDIGGNDNPTVLTSGGATWLGAGWYVVNSDVEFNTRLYSEDEIHLILCDGATLTVTDGLYGICITTLHIYGQTLGTGTINAQGTSSSSGKGINSTNSLTINGGIINAQGVKYGIYANNSVTINGGQVTANGQDIYGIRTAFDDSNITINGGQVTANGGTTGISSKGNITLGWTKPTDFIYANSYMVFGGTLSIADGQSFYNGSEVLSGAISYGDWATMLDDKTLRSTFPAFADSGDGSAEHPYTIWNAEGWDAFCDRLAADDGKAFFSGKTVKLGADISVSRMAGNDNHDFCGTFDGQGHTLTFTAEATDNYLAPFRNVLGNSSDDHAVIKDLKVVTNITAEDYRHTAGLIAVVWGYVDVTNCNVTVDITANTGSTQTELYPTGLASQVVKGAQLTVSGCTVGGIIATDGKYAAGLVGIVQGSASIVNSVSSVTINSSTAGDGTHGGLVAVSYPGSTNIEGCLFNGKLLTVGTIDTKNCGGFVGWRNTGTVTISNSLYAPADLAGGETEVKFVEGESHPSATFVRNGVSSITNSYYTRTLGTTQGKQARIIMKDDDVSVAHAGEPTTYDVSGITAYKETENSSTFSAGLLYNKELYAGSGDQVSLTLTNTPPDGYGLGGYTASAGSLSGSANPYTLTMPDANVMISAMFAPIISVSYIDENGVEQTVDAIDLSKFSAFPIPGGVYSFSSEYVKMPDFDISGDVTIIIPDDFELNFNYIYGGKSVTFYGQEKGNGKLDVEAEVISSVTVYGGSFTNGGGIGGDVTVYGGSFTNGGSAHYMNIYGGNVRIDGTVLSVDLSWTNLSDSFYAKDISYGVEIAEDKTFYDEDGNAYSGTIDSDATTETSPIGGKTLRPLTNVLVLNDDADNTAAVSGSTGQRNVILQGRKLWKDGAWNTLCLPFDVDLTDEEGTLYGATVMKLNPETSELSGTTLTLNFDDAPETISAGTPFIVKWDNTGETITDPVFQGVTVSTANNDVTFTGGAFKGSYSYMEWAAGTTYKSILLLGANSKLFWPNGENVSRLGACRAYFELSDGVNAREFVLNFGDATGVRLIDNGKLKIENEAGAWYDLQGRRLDAQPTKAGVYIHGGCKVVVP